MHWHKLFFEASEKEAPTIQLPASKSIANRLLVLQHIAKQKIEIENLSTANDSILLNEILSKKQIPQHINCQDAGTVLRFMTCLCAATPGSTFYLTGTPRLMQRPMQPLISALIELGAQIKPIFIDEKISALEIVGQQLVSKKIRIAGNVSSQFISGLCLIAPLIKKGLSLTIDGPILSKPYIDLTLKTLSQIGIQSTFENGEIRIEPQKIKSTKIKVAADWSGATFFYAYMILLPTGTSIQIADLKKEATQGDQYIATLAEQFGISTSYDTKGAILKKENVAKPPVEIDLSDFPDLAIPLIVCCAFRYPEIRFTGLSHLRAKESDRIAALQRNLENFDILLKEKNGRLWIDKFPDHFTSKVVKIETFADHRIAMSFSIIAVLGYEIWLDNTNCIDKSFPQFLTQLSKLGIRSKN